jgi:hypothetical protein
MRKSNAMRGLALWLAGCVVAACGHLQGDKAEVRVFNALYDYDTLDLFVGERPKIEDLPFGVLSDPVGVSVVGEDEPPDGNGGRTTTTNSVSSTSSTSTTLAASVADVTAALVTTTTETSSSTTTSTTTTTLASGSRTMRVFVDELATRLIEQAVSMTSDQKYTIFAYQGLGSGQLARLIVEKESKQKLIEGKLKIRVANMAPSSGIVAVYVLEPGQSVTDQLPASVRLVPSGISEYFDVDPGKYRIVFTQIGTKTVVFNSGLVDLAETTVQTMIVSDKKGGGRPLQYVLTEN